MDYSKLPGASIKPVIATPPDPTQTPDQMATSSTFGAARRGTVRGAAPAAVGLAAGIPGAEAGGTLGFGIAGPPGMLAGSIIGGLVTGIPAAMAASYGQEKLFEAAPDLADALGQSPEQRAIDMEQHPYASFVGELAPNLLAFRPSFSTLSNTSKLAAAAEQKALAEGATQAVAKSKGMAARNAVIGQRVNAIVNSGVSGAVDLGHQMASGEPVDLTRTAMAAGFGLLGQKETFIGRRVVAAGRAITPPSVRERADILFGRTSLQDPADGTGGPTPPNVDPTQATGPLNPRPVRNISASADAQRTIFDQLNQGRIPTALDNSQAPPVPKDGQIGSRVVYEVQTNDGNVFGTTLFRLKNGAVQLNFGSRSTVIPKEMVGAATDADILKYAFNPIGFREANSVLSLSQVNAQRAPSPLSGEQMPLFSDAQAPIPPRQPTEVLADGGQMDLFLSQPPQRPATALPTQTDMFAGQPPIQPDLFAPQNRPNELPQSRVPQAAPAPRAPEQVDMFGGADQRQPDLFGPENRANEPPPPPAAPESRSPRQRDMLEESPEAYAASDFNFHGVLQRLRSAWSGKGKPLEPTSTEQLRESQRLSDILRRGDPAELEAYLGELEKQQRYIETAPLKSETIAKRQRMIDAKRDVIEDYLARMSDARRQKVSAYADNARDMARSGEIVDRAPEDVGATEAQIREKNAAQARVESGEVPAENPGQPTPKLKAALARRDQREAATAQERDRILQDILADDNTRNPEERFRAALRANGMRDLNITQDEQGRIDRWRDATEAFTAPRETPEQMRLFSNDETPIPEGAEAPLNEGPLPPETPVETPRNENQSEMFTRTGATTAQARGESRAQLIAEADAALREVKGKASQTIMKKAYDSFMQRSKDIGHVREVRDLLKANKQAAARKLVGGDEPPAPAPAPAQSSAPDPMVARKRTSLRGIIKEAEQNDVLSKIQATNLRSELAKDSPDFDSVERTVANAAREYQKKSPEVAEDPVAKPAVDKSADDAEADAQIADYLKRNPKPKNYGWMDNAGDDGDVNLSRNRRRGGSTVDTVRAAVENATASWKKAPAIEVVQSAKDLPTEAPSDTDGLYYKGKLYLVADNIHSDGHAKAVLYHEGLGHFGLKGKFGKALGGIMRDAYRTNATFRDAVDYWLATNINTPEAKKFYSRYNEDQLIEVAGEEVLAQISERGPAEYDKSTQGVLDRVAAAVRTFARQMGLKMDYSREDIFEVLRQAHKYTTAGGKAMPEQSIDRTLSRLSRFNDDGKVLDFRKAAIKSARRKIDEAARQGKITQDQVEFLTDGLDESMVDNVIPEQVVKDLEYLLTQNQQDALAFVNELGQFVKDNNTLNTMIKDFKRKHKAFEQLEYAAGHLLPENEYTGFLMTGDFKGSRVGFDGYEMQRLDVQLKGYARYLDDLNAALAEDSWSSIDRLNVIKKENKAVKDYIEWMTSYIDDSFKQFADNPPKFDKRKRYAEQQRGAYEYATRLYNNKSDDNVTPLFDSRLSRDRWSTNADGDRIFKTREGIENFWNWFGESKLVNENGKPLVLYHGGFDLMNQPLGEGVFKPSRKGKLGPGIYLTPSNYLADAYKTNFNNSVGKNAAAGAMHSYYVRMENPLVVEPKRGLNPTLLDVTRKLGMELPANAFRMPKEVVGQKVQEEARRQGYDGIIYKDHVEIVEVVAFDETAVKSTRFNNGDFSRTQKDVRLSRSVEDGPLPDEVMTRFLELGEMQRDRPESAMLQFQSTHSGVMNWMTEHLGDLTHRMTHMAKWGPQYGYGREYVTEKVDKALRMLTRPYGFLREHNENLDSNVRHRNVDKAEYMARFNKALQRYVDEHKKLPVYNRAQWLGREIAVDIGELRVDDAIRHLRELDRMTSTQEIWNREATKYTLDESGKPLPYDGTNEAPFKLPEGTYTRQAKENLDERLDQIKSLEELGIYDKSEARKARRDAALYAEMDSRLSRNRGADDEAIVNDNGAFFKTAKGEESPARAGFRKIAEDDDIALNNPDLVGSTLITGIDAKTPGSGAGSKLLQNITEWADKTGKTLVAVPTRSSLKAWYSRNGFKDMGDYMVRSKSEDVLSRELLDDSKYFYHAVRSDDDIPGIVANGLRPGTNVGKTTGQPFSGEGDTVLVFERNGAQLERKSYQGDEIVMGGNPKPKAILKDTSVREQLKTQDDELNELGDRYEANEKRQQEIFKELGVTEDEFNKLRYSGEMKGRNGAVKRFGELGGELIDLQGEANRIVYQSERAMNRSEPGIVKSKDVLAEYEKHGLPVHKLNIKYGDDEAQQLSIGDARLSRSGKFDEPEFLDSEGRPVHPTAEGRNNFFNKWGAQKPIVTENGTNPLRLRHGTTKDFEDFKMQWEKYRDELAEASKTQKVMTPEEFDAAYNNSPQFIRISTMLGAHVAPDPEITSTFGIPGSRAELRSNTENKYDYEKWSTLRPDFGRTREPQSEDYGGSNLVLYGRGKLLDLRGEKGYDDAIVARAVARQSMNPEYMVGAVKESGRTLSLENAKRLMEFWASKKTRMPEDLEAAVSAVKDYFRTKDDFIRNFVGSSLSMYTRGPGARMVLDFIKNSGYDGIVYENTSPVETLAAKKNDSYIFFHPNDLKSAISNTGEFSEAREIRLSRRPQDLTSNARRQAEELFEGMPAEVRDPVRSIYDNIAYVGKRNITSWAFTPAIAKNASDAGVTAAEDYVLHMQEREKLKKDKQIEVERVLNAFEVLPEELKGTGAKSVNRLIFDSTTEGKWAFKPEWMEGFNEARVDANLAARFNALPKAAQDVIKDVFRYGHNTLRETKNGVLETVAAEYRQRLANTNSKLVDAFDQAYETSRGLDAKDATLAAFEASMQAAKGTEYESLVKSSYSDLKADLAKFHRLLSLNEGQPYAPKRRFGKYVVVGYSNRYAELKDAVARNEAKQKDLDELKASPNDYFVDFATTAGEAQGLQRDLAARFGKDNVTWFEKERAGYQGGDKDLYLAFQRLNRMLTDHFSEVGDKTALNKARQLVSDLYLSTLFETSSRKSEFRRLNVPGREMDMMRAFASKGLADAHFLGNLYKNGDVLKSISQMQKQVSERNVGRAERAMYVNELLTRHAMTMSSPNMQIANVINRASSVWFLAMSPSYYLQNISQPMVMSLPYMAGRHGYPMSIREFWKAYKDLGPMVKAAKATEPLNLEKNLPQDVQSVLRELILRGQIDIGIDTDLGTWASQGNGKLTQHWNAVDRGLRNLVQKTETINRLATGMAAYRTELKTLARSGVTGKRAQEAALKYASDVITTTHGNYDAFSAPKYFNMPVGKVALQFRKFQLIQIAMLAKLLRNSFNAGPEALIARKALGFSLAHAAALAGAAGMPGWMAIKWLYNKLAGDENESRDLEKDLREAIGDEQLATMILRGAPAAAGVDMSQRLGFGNTFSVFPYADMKGVDRESYANTLLAAAGPAIGGLVPRALDAMGYMSRGDYYRGLELLLPTGMPQGLAKANRLAEDGVTKQNGQVLIPPEDVSEMTLALTALGLPSTQLTSNMWAREVERNTTEFYSKRSAQVKLDYVRARMEGDQEGVAEAMKAWRELQKARKAAGLKVQPMSQLPEAYMLRRRNERRTKAGIERDAQNRQLVNQLAEMSDGQEDAPPP